MTYGLSFEDLIVRVAEATRTASFDAPNGDTDDNRARIPTDPHRLDRCKRAINDGLRWIVTARRWNVLRRWQTITIDSAGTRPNAVDGRADWYWLPDLIAGPPTNAAWSVQAADGEYVSRAAAVSVDVVTNLAFSGTQTGRPQYIACVAATPTGQNQVGWQVRVWPSPDGEYTLSAEFRVHQPPLVMLDDRHVLGPQFDDLVISTAIWKYKSIDSSEPSERDAYKNESNESLARAMSLDDELAPRSVGTLLRGQTTVGPRNSQTVTLNGVQIAP